MSILILDFANTGLKLLRGMVVTIVLCVACSPSTPAITQTSIAPPTPTTTTPTPSPPSQPRKPYTYKQGGFALTPPPDWQFKQISGLKYGVWESGDGASINVVDGTFSGTLAEYADLNLASVAKAFKRFKKISQAEFQTNSGLTGIEVVSESQQLGNQLRQSFYFFASPPDQKPDKKIIVTCTSTAKDVDRLAAICATSLKTFKFGI